MANWYYSQDGQQQGPIAEAELQQKVQSGQLASSSLVWKQGMGDWVAASTLEVFQVTGMTPTVSPVPSSGPSSPYAAPSAPVHQGYGVQPQQTMGARPRNYMAQSIILTVLSLMFCGLPIGIVPLIFSIMVNSKYDSGDYQGSLSSSSTAKTWCIVCWSLVGVLVLIVFLFIVLIGIAGSAG